MAVAFTRFSYWIWGSKDHETPNTSPNSSSEFPSGYREPDSLRFSSIGPRIRSSTRRVKRKWQSREERRRIDREYDIVLVPSDGGCMSGSESEDSDWSVGWLEPHGSDFDSDAENSFAVLVPCYGRGRCEKVEAMKSGALGAVYEQNVYSSADKDYIEQWLSSLQEV
ncbi:uncharacterized protein LOC109840332 [Asparagus officinalis]|nr:uncharacterized protein LOC109840332 [Asparagus officinalis]XP_020264523.1 uncharacterized protein LOC109840332 [Asparagus officinalis]